MLYMQIGSGFDVAAAVFGSQLYKRFSPEMLKPLVDRQDEIGKRIETLRADWDCSNVSVFCQACGPC